MTRCPCCRGLADVTTRYTPGSFSGRGHAWQALCDRCLDFHARLQSCPHQEARERRTGTILPVLPHVVHASMSQALAAAGVTVASARGS